MASRPDPDLRTANQVVAENIYRLRETYGWSRKRLVRTLNMHLIPDNADWTMSKLANIEMGRDPHRGSERARHERRITVDELVLFGQALRVSLFDLVLPHGDREMLIGDYSYAGTRDDAAVMLFHLRGAAELSKRLSSIETEWRHYQTAVLKLFDAYHYAQADDWRDADLTPEELGALAVYDEDFEKKWERDMKLRNQYFAQKDRGS